MHRTRHSGSNGAVVTPLCEGCELERTLSNSPIDHVESLYTTLEAAGHEVALEVLDTRHAELIDPTDPAGAHSVEAIITATRSQIEPGHTGPSTTLVYARLATQQR